MPYRAPLRDMTLAARIVGQDRLARTARFAEATPETRDAILDEAAKMTEAVLAPLDRPGDVHGSRLENGVVRTPPGYREGYRAIAEGGWIGMSAAQAYGGMGLPFSFQVMANEMMTSACVSLSLCPLLTQGQIDALEAHASEAQKAIYLPKLIAGDWTGTMDLTEPQAGSDVGALTTKAEPNGDGTHAITGQKIYISWGDHDMAENVVHLVLARLPDAPKGTRGISLFIVPKHLPDEDGNPGRANALKVVSLEHKLGLHGSPTAVLEYDRATGWMVGAENTGMRAMFTMMNAARVGVGVQGYAVGEAALQRAVAYALDRAQGPTPDGSKGIAGHADVRRMLLRMAALTRVARCICYDCALSIDMAAASEGEEAERHRARAAFLTPIAKAFGTDAGSEVADLGVQVHGGMGFIEETGAAQHLRDVRVSRIYEGTNGIQAMDLIGRKLADGGAAARALLDEIEGTVADLRAADEGALADGLEAARSKLSGLTGWMLEAEMTDRAAGATAYLEAWALTLGGHYLARAALTEGGEHAALARFYVARMLPEAHALAQAACAGSADLYAVAAERLSA